MDEHQALLGPSFRLHPQLPPNYRHPPPPVRPPNITHEPQPNSAVGDGNNNNNISSRSSNLSSTSSSSGSWTSRSHSTQSSCSSCASSTSTSSEECWEAHVSSDGSLLYIEASSSLQLSSEPTSSFATPLKPKQGGGKFARWIRRRESSRQHRKSNTETSSVKVSNDLKLINVPVVVDVTKSVIDSSVLGFRTEFEMSTGRVFVHSLRSKENRDQCPCVAEGDVIREVNGIEVNSGNFDNVLATNIKPPCQVTLGVESRDHRKFKTVSSKKVDTLLHGCSEMFVSTYSSLPIGVLVFDVKSEHDIASTADDEQRQQDLIFSYPQDSALNNVRGAFITLSHLLPSITARSSDGLSCSSCSINGEQGHVVFLKEGTLVMVVVTPARRKRIQLNPVDSPEEDFFCIQLQEAVHFTYDLSRCLMFNHQTLQRCFRQKRQALEKFFSTALEQVVNTEDWCCRQLYHWMHCVPYVSLPREAQLQLDDALNELEAGDLSEDVDDGLESNRAYVITGSCIYHQGYLLASHLPKEDLLDVHSLLRQHGLLDLMKNEGVDKLVLWREVFPSSVNRGFKEDVQNFSRTNSENKTERNGSQSQELPPVARWFLLAVASGNDLLCVILEASEGTPGSGGGPDVELTRDAEDTLAHVQQRLALTAFARQWIAKGNRPATTFPRPRPRPQPTAAAPHHHQIASMSQPRNEDDEEQLLLSNQYHRDDDDESDSSSNSESSGTTNSSALSPSDWGSLRESCGGGLGEGSSGGLFDNPYHRMSLDDLDQMTATKITTGVENVLFHYVQLDGNEGVVITQMVDDVQRDLHTTAAQKLIYRFTWAAREIHEQFEASKKIRNDLQCNIQQANTLSVKEYGVLLDADGENQHCYWVVGRLFFTPRPREVYVCYRDDPSALQNLLEIAFRIALMIPG